MFRERVGRLLIVAAGGGCLAVLIFVVLPMMDGPAPPKTQDGIVAEVMGSDSQETGGSDDRTAGADRVVPVLSPLVGVRNDREEVPVVFPSSEVESAAEQNPFDDTGPLPPLSADDVAAARAALAGREAGPFALVEDAVAERPGVPEALPAAAPETGGPADPGGNEVKAVVLSETEAPAAGEVVQITEVAKAESELTVVPAPDSDVMEQLAVPLESGEAEVSSVESVPVNGTGVRRMVDVPGARRVEFDLPVSPGSRAPRGVSHPSGRGTEQGGAVVPGTLRGVMGYRLPLVSRQEVPDQIVSGVLIPAHTTFVILKAGSWELVDVTPEELRLLREAAAAREAPVVEAEAARKGWSPLRIFRKR